MPPVALRAGSAPAAEAPEGPEGPERARIGPARTARPDCQSLCAQSRVACVAGEWQAKRQRGAAHAGWGAVGCGCWGARDPLRAPEGGAAARGGHAQVEPQARTRAPRAASASPRARAPLLEGDVGVLAEKWRRWRSARSSRGRRDSRGKMFSVSFEADASAGAGAGAVAGELSSGMGAKSRVDGGLWRGSRRASAGAVSSALGARPGTGDSGREREAMAMAEAEIPLGKPSYWDVRPRSRRCARPACRGARGWHC